MKQLWYDIKNWIQMYLPTSPPENPEEISAKEWLDENFPTEEEWEEDV